MLFKKNITLSSKIYFFDSLYQMITSGLDLKTSLEIISSNTKNDISTHAKTILTKITNGQELSHAIKDSRSFNKLDSTLIRVAEKSGSFDYAFENLAKYYTSKLKNRKKILQILTYPSIVIIFSILVVFIISKLIFPQILSTYNTLGIEMPQLTTTIINLINNLPKIFMLFIVIILLYQFVNRYFKNDSKLKYYAHKCLAYIPGLNKYIHLINYLLFFNIVYYMLRNHSTIDESIQIGSESIRNTYLQKRVKTLKQFVISGDSITDSFRKSMIFTDAFLLSTIEVFERTGKIHSAFEKIVSHYENKLDSIIKTIESVAEPILIIVVGVVVGIILISMYLPIFDINSLILK